MASDRDGGQELEQNELFCHRLAARLGLHVEVQNGGEAPRGGEETSFCEVLGRPPERCREEDGGPGLEDCFALLAERGARPALDRLRLLDAVLFAYLCGDTRLHGASLHLLRTPRGLRLAPLRGMQCSEVQPGAEPGLAMGVGGRFAFNEIMPRHWAALPRAIGMSPRFVRERLRRLAGEIETGAGRVRQELSARGGEPGPLQRIEAAISRRVERLRRRFRWGEVS
jgi:serine/threonine-protein kinase HipA